jgi:hypothetical protein
VRHSPLTGKERGSLSKSLLTAKVCLFSLAQEEKQIATQKFTGKGKKISKIKVEKPRNCNGDLFSTAHLVGLPEVLNFPADQLSFFLLHLDFLDGLKICSKATVDILALQSIWQTPW